MRILVVGAGTLGWQAAAALTAAGNRVTVVDRDERRLERLAPRLPGVELVPGDGCDVGVLEAAGALRADVLAALTGRDEDNLVVSLLAKRRCQVAQVVARVNDPGNRWLFGEAWGVDAAVSASAALVALIEEATRSAATVDLLRLRQAGLELLETTLTASSPVTGRPVGALPLPPGLTVTTVIRAGEPLPPEAAGALAAGDQLLILSRTTDEADVQALFQGDAGPGRTGPVGRGHDAPEAGS